MAEKYTINNICSDSVVRKYTGTKTIADYDILTDTGWEKLESVSETVEYEVWKVTTKSGRVLECADTHILFKTGTEEVFVKDLLPGNEIMTESGLEKIVSIENTGKKEHMYDVSLAETSNKRFYANGMLSHNSTMYCVYALWLTCFFREKKVMILANKAPTAMELIDKIETAYKYLPYWLKPPVATYNKGEIMFTNKSGVKSFASSSDAARGWSANVVILDEFSFLQNSIADKLFTSMYGTISSSENGKIIIVSTPNGTGNLYYKLWTEANSKTAEEGAFKPYIMWWWQIPGHDENWKKRQIAAIGEERFAQEYNNEFLAGSTFQKLIPDDIIEKYRMKLSGENKKYIPPCKYLQVISTSKKKAYQFRMWHEFKSDRTYIASGDISEGLGNGADSSVLYIWDVTDLRHITMCAEYSSNSVGPVEFAFVISKILGLYGNPYFICESNGLGSSFLDTLRSVYEYENIVTESRNGGLGVRSHAQTKARACIWLKEMFTTDGFGWEIYDEELIDQMSTFIKKASKFASYAAIKGAHDDKMMTLCWAAYVLQPDIIEKYMTVTEFFTTSLEAIMPRFTQPLHLLTPREISKIFEDPLYRQFMQFKAEAIRLNADALLAERAENEFDLKYNFQENMSPQELLLARKLEYAQLEMNEPQFAGGSLVGGYVLVDGCESIDYDFSGPEW